MSMLKSRCRMLFLAPLMFWNEMDAAFCGSVHAEARRRGDFAAEGVERRKPRSREHPA